MEIDNDAMEVLRKVLGTLSGMSKDIQGDILSKLINPLINNAADQIQMIYDNLLKEKDEGIQVLIHEMKFTIILIPLVVNLIHCLLTIDEKEAIIAFFSIASQINNPEDKILPSMIIYLNRKYPEKSYPDLHLHLDKISNTVSTIIGKDLMRI